VGHSFRQVAGSARRASGRQLVPYQLPHLARYRLARAPDAQQMPWSCQSRLLPRPTCAMRNRGITSSSAALRPQLANCN
jgi:hypothetical protein